MPRESLARAEADPLGTRLARAEAEQRFVLAEASLEQAYNEATLETITAYAEMFTARRGLSCFSSKSR